MTTDDTSPDAHDNEHERDHDHDQDQEHEHEHDHDHSHEHDHAERDPNSDPTTEARTRAIQSLLVEKGLVSTDAVETVIESYEHDVGPLNGARVVARAWADPEFKERLLDDADGAIAAFDFEIGDQEIQVVENTPEAHNVVVCTLCSCYPWSLLGLPPTWYKSPAYRARIVREPRTVLREFGVDLPESVDISVRDANAELRFLVLPQRPAGTDDLTEAELAEVVTRDSMVGVERLG